MCEPSCPSLVLWTTICSQIALAGVSLSVESTILHPLKFVVIASIDIYESSRRLQHGSAGRDGFPDSNAVRISLFTRRGKQNMMYGGQSKRKLYQSQKVLSYKVVVVPSVSPISILMIRSIDSLCSII
jgi:hypothetical protein